MKKIVHLIVNKDASMKDVSKQLLKLQAMICDARVASLYEDYSKLCQKIEDCELPANKSALTKKLVNKQTTMNHEFVEWSKTTSCEALTPDGQIRDECNMTYPVDYLETDSANFDRIVKEIQSSFKNGQGANVCPKWAEQSLRHHKNVLIVMPLYLNGHLDRIIQEIKSK